MELLPCLASHKSSIFSCSDINRILHFPSSAHAGHLHPTHPLPAWVSILAPLYSNFPQMSTELCGGVLSIQCTCINHTTITGLKDHRWSCGTQGYVQGLWQHHTPYLSWQCKSGTEANKWTNIQAVLHSVVMAAWLFICVPSSEKEAAPIGSRCERRDRQQPERWQPGPRGCSAIAELLRCHIEQLL